MSTNFGKITRKKFHKNPPNESGGVRCGLTVAIVNFFADKTKSYGGLRQHTISIRLQMM